MLNALARLDRRPADRRDRCRALRASAARAPASAACRRPARRSAATHTGRRRCDLRGRASAPARTGAAGTAADRSDPGISRSTPGSSGPANITPASMTSVVSIGRHGHRVHAEFAEPAERDHLYRWSSLSSWFRRHVRGTFALAGVLCRVRISRDAPLGATTRPGCWALPEGEGKRIAQLTLRPQRKRRQVCDFNDLQRLGPPRGSMPAAASACRARAPGFGAQRRQRIRQRLSPLGEHAADHRSNSAGSCNGNGGRPKRSRMSAERTVGGGRNAPGGRASSRVTSARHCTSTLRTP